MIKNVDFQTPVCILAVKCMICSNESKLLVVPK